MKDLFDNITPGFGPFAPIFDSWVGVLIAAVWAGAFIYCAVQLVIGIGAVAKARKQHRVDSESTVWAILWPIGAIVGLVLVPVIWAALVTA
ncbi:hypothetical protein [Tessaracoccus flavescens]|uniref:Uncharacterized protein n=1 Tax=Tessaracoccus flavescens TaxID=399497 RepID=A0A1Q2D310_9ACTN|nr:hypothetical protein [Tessaracoccus flavescens]AQP52735.1 hypothetical protein BW733_17725 [Tessaracoccus flavescens]